MTDADSFPPNVVCVALGIPPNTLGTWSKRGRFAGFDAASTSRGRARQFTLVDALALSLLKAASDRGIDRPELSAFVHNAAFEWVRHDRKLTELNILDYPGPEGLTRICFDECFNKEALKPGWTVRTTFILADIFARAEAALRLVNDGLSDTDAGELLPG